MRRPGAADEADSAGPRAEGARRRFLGLGDLGPRRHAEIAVRIHAEERAVTLAGEGVSRSLVATWRDDAGDDRFAPTTQAVVLLIL